MMKTVGQALTPPHLVSDSENPSATKVCGYSYLEQILFYKLHCLASLQMHDIREEYSVWRCYDIGSSPFYFDLLIFIYLGLLQIVGIILAFQTRKVKIRVLNDSKFVAALVYISSIVLVVMVLTTFILRSYINISAAIFSGGIIILATIFLALMFIPKVYRLLDVYIPLLYGTTSQLNAVHYRWSTCIRIPKERRCLRIQILPTRVKRAYLQTVAYLQVCQSSQTEREYPC